MVQVKNLSPHLFWDTDSKKLDLNVHKRFVIQRVLEYGLLKDWLLLSNNFSFSEIANEAAQIPGLDKRAASFIAFLGNFPIKNFRCYSTKQLTRKHWSL